MQKYIVKQAKTKIYISKALVFIIIYFVTKNRTFYKYIY